MLLLSDNACSRNVTVESLNVLISDHLFNELQVDFFQVEIFQVDF